MKGHLKVHGTYRDPGFTIEQTYAGDLDLSLQPDGSFAGSGALTMSFSTTASLPDEGSCSETGTELNPPAQTMGDYRDADGSLSFETLVVSADAFQGTLVCSSRDGSATCSISAPSAASAATNWTCTCLSADGEVATCTYQGGVLVCVSSHGTVTVPVPSSNVSLGGDLMGNNNLAVALTAGALLTIPPPADLPAGFSWDATLQLTYGAGSGPSGPAADSLVPPAWATD